MASTVIRILPINDLPVVPNLALVLPTGKLLFLVAGRPEVIEAIVFESQKFQIPNMLCVYIDPVVSKAIEQAIQLLACDFATCACLVAWIKALQSRLLICLPIDP